MEGVGYLYASQSDCWWPGIFNYSSNNLIASSLFAEVFAAILVLESAKDKGRMNLWPKCDSALVIQAFHSPSIVPWRLHSRWENCLFFSKDIVLVVSHVYMEGNACADKLANHEALSRVNFQWWDSSPFFVRDEFFRNRNTLPMGFGLVPPFVLL